MFIFELAENIENVFNNEKKNNSKSTKFEYRNIQLIHSIEIYKGMNSIYGYHSESESVFLKISIYDPSHLKQLREVLWSGLVYGYRFQSYEAHIDYSMHFFTD